ncbi:unnamed protein product [Meloidogyne enterolobii]|uniref:Uncharacterized protein n=2 Tax=Meloidogyne enterolobii TaxID=390850 RepID=A0ACB1B761_MELEN|nr:unnamed protein product [Meloidogyne enterolobii]
MNFLLLLFTLGLDIIFKIKNGSSFVGLPHLLPDTIACPLPFFLTFLFTPSPQLFLTNAFDDKKFSFFSRGIFYSNSDMAHYFFFIPSFDGWVLVLFNSGPIQTLLYFSMRL